MHKATPPPCRLLFVRQPQQEIGHRRFYHSRRPIHRSAPPTLGEQTESVLAERLAMSAADIEALRARGII
jgi:crotonobetainyl-CoA:carnitine CoA-transferase CaiB-like acyl-CoA transferase